MIGGKFEWTWSFFIKHVLIGTLVAIGGYMLRLHERRRPQEQRRQWVIVTAYAIMLAGAVYGLGFGDFIFFHSLIENIKG